MSSLREYVYLQPFLIGLGASLHIWPCANQLRASGESGVAGAALEIDTDGDGDGGPVPRERGCWSITPSGGRPAGALCQVLPERRQVRFWPRGCYGLYSCERVRLGCLTATFFPGAPLPPDLLIQDDLGPYRLTAQVPQTSTS